MVSTRGALLGTGVALLVAGFFISTLLCGVGVIFLILGLVMWQRDDDER